MVTEVASPGACTNIGSNMDSRNSGEIPQAFSNALVFGDAFGNPGTYSSGIQEESSTAAAAASTDQDDPDDWEDMETFKQRLIYWIGQMMFVSGETAEPSPETTWMIEEIVREQVVEMVCPFNLLFCVVLLTLTTS